MRQNAALQLASEYGLPAIQLSQPTVQLPQPTMPQQFSMPVIYMLCILLLFKSNLKYSIENQVTSVYNTLFFAFTLILEIYPLMVGPYSWTKPVRTCQSIKYLLCIIRFNINNFSTKLFFIYILF